MTSTIKTPDVFRLLDRLSPTLTLHVVALAPTSASHIYATDERDARRRVLEINANADIVSITRKENTL